MVGFLFIILAVVISVLSGPSNSSTSSIVKEAAIERGENVIETDLQTQDAVLDLDEETE